jgi:hypothetical protein
MDKMRADMGGAAAVTATLKVRKKGGGGYSKPDWVYCVYIFLLPEIA